MPLDTTNRHRFLADKNGYPLNAQFGWIEDVSTFNSTDDIEFKDAKGNWAPVNLWVDVDSEVAVETILGCEATLSLKANALTFDNQVQVRKIIQADTTYGASAVVRAFHNEGANVRQDVAAA